ncbi:MAG: hypothetical protein IKM00_10305 [Clostridia bacterium]|nr:hypothetical protein [Clostridia bacterium]
MVWSLETAVFLAARAVEAICAVTVYLFLIVRVLPDLLLSPRVRTLAEGDRGIRRYVYENGRAILYEPSASDRIYMKRYLLSVHGGTAHGEKKYMQCQFDERVEEVSYEATALDSRGRRIATARASEKLAAERNGISRPLLLPARTAYAKVSVRAVNGEALALSVPASRARIFSAVTALGLCALMLMLRSILVSVAERLFGYADPASVIGVLFTALTSLAAGVLLARLIWNLRVAK